LRTVYGNLSFNKEAITIKFLPLSGPTTNAITFYWHSVSNSFFKKKGK